MRRLPAAAALAAGLGVALLLPAPGPAQQQGAIVSTLTLFAGTSEGLWRSTDWASSWHRVVGRTSGVRLDGLGGVRALFLLASQVWAGGDGGLYFSEDFGETWAPLSLTPGVRSVVASRWPLADPTVFVGTPGGLLRSVDGGRTFAPTALAGAAVHRLEWPAGALVVACDRGLLLTRDLGARMEGPGKGLPEGPVRAMALSSFFSIDPVLFAAPDSGGVFRSSDGGATWAASGLTDEFVGDLVWLGPFLYAAGERGFYRSQDAGASFSRLSASPGRPSRLMFPLAPAAGLEAFLATDRGLFRTVDAGEHWQPAGFAGQEVLEVATFPPPEPEPSKKPRR
jgi:photosystem II stability/assembly factor-like uncharacterized protein